MVRTILFVCAIITVMCSAGSSAAETWNTVTEQDFDLGTYGNVIFNSTTGAVQLSGSNITGNYTSMVFDGGSEKSWENITWTEGLPYGEGLPDFMGSEIVAGGMDMVGNVLLFHFDNDASYGENNTYLFDFSGNGNNGTVWGGQYDNADSRVGAASFAFDGVDDNVSLSDVSGLGQSMTVSAWVKVYSHKDWNFFVQNEWSADGGWGMVSDSFGTASFSVLDGATYKSSSFPTMPIGIWHHLSGTYDGNEIALYVNGQKMPPASLPGKLLQTSGAMGIGGDDGYSMDGALDEVAVWNRTLSDSEIMSMYRRGALRLNLSARSCNDFSCTGEAFVPVSDSPPQTLTSSDNRYFQFMSQFWSDIPALTPELFDVTVEFDNSSVPIPTGLNLTVRLVINNTDNYVYMPGEGEIYSGSIIGHAILNPPHFYLASYLGGALTGLVAGHGNEIGVEQSGSTHTLELNQEFINSRILLPFTGGDYKKVQDSITLIESGSFFSQISPSFSYGLGFLYPIKIIIEYNDIDIDDDLRLSKGDYKLVISYSGLSGSTPIISMDIK